MIRNNSVNQPQKICIIDDDVELCILMKTYLEQQGFDVFLAHHGDEAVAEINKCKPDVVVLDLMLPGTDGLTICRTIRKQFVGPILMFTALCEEIDEVAGLETGADDYLKKPVQPRLLLARIRALLRRSSVVQEAPSDSQGVLTEGELVVDTLRRAISYRGESLKLSTVEYDLLSLLVSQAGQVITRQDIYQAMRRLDYDGLDRSIDMYISRLRKKIGEDPKEPELIKTVRGVGYFYAKS
ncbi:MAG: response regulator transcription factor [Porticoccaceae bacterium]|nr:response regulator transcription factor [Porticoccaceae bacterium]